MKHTFKSPKTSLLKTIAFVLTLGMIMSACAQTGRSGADSWKEEVLLHDGQKIIVERSQSYGGRSEPGQSGPIREHTIRFNLPGSNKPITWVSEYGEDLGRANFNLLAVHALNGTPYVVASPNLCPSYNKWGRPNPPYVFFKFEGNTWQRVALEAFPAEFKTVNVVLSIQKVEAGLLSSAGLTTAEKVKELNVHVEPPEFKTILREPLSKAKCGDRIFYKGQWIVDSPTARAIVDFNQK
jgi:hypothetical protein